MSEFIDSSEIAGIYPISNTGCIVIHEIDYVDDKVLASFNGKDPEWCNITEREIDDEWEMGFRFGETFVPFAEVMRMYSNED